jgi:uncharacterized protein YprB with RNaseH-like and TPR domain
MQRSTGENILFLDIETVPQAASYEDVPSEMQEHWQHKAKLLAKGEDVDAAEMYERAGIYAEFGKIVCISSGFIRRAVDGQQLHITSFFGDDETDLLQRFADMLNRLHDYELCAHNGKEFDFPYICRRMIVHGIPIPDILNTMGKKPWEVRHLDTMEMWKFGDRKNFTGLALLADLLKVPTPKDDIDGSKVREVYYEGGLDRIVAYCQKDVVALAQIFLRLNHLETIKETSIIIR